MAMANVITLHHIDDFFADVGGLVTHALERTAQENLGQGLRDVKGRGLGGVLLHYYWKAA
jgi:hypothetical protein